VRERIALACRSGRFGRVATGVPLESALEEADHTLTRAHRQAIPSLCSRHQAQVGVHSQDQDVLAAAEIGLDPLSTAPATNHLAHVCAIHIRYAGDIMKIWFTIEEARDARVWNQFERLRENAFDGLNALVGTIQAKAEVLLGVRYGSLSKCLDELLTSIFHGHLTVTEMDSSIGGNQDGIVRKVGGVRLKLQAKLDA
jgi:hypothetical protein